MAPRRRFVFQQHNAITHVAAITQATNKWFKTTAQTSPNNLWLTDDQDLTMQIQWLWSVVKLWCNVFMTGSLCLYHSRAPTNKLQFHFISLTDNWRQSCQKCHSLLRAKAQEKKDHCHIEDWMDSQSYIHSQVARYQSQHPRSGCVRANISILFSKLFTSHLSPWVDLIYLYGENPIKFEQQGLQPSACDYSLGTTLQQWPLGHSKKQGRA